MTLHPRHHLHPSPRLRPRALGSSVTTLRAPARVRARRGSERPRGGTGGGYTPPRSSRLGAVCLALIAHAVAIAAGAGCASAPPTAARGDAGAAPGGSIAERVVAGDDRSTRVEVRGASLRVLDIAAEEAGGEPGTAGVPTGDAQASSLRAGVAVVLVHGYGSRLEAWRLVQPALAEAGVRSVAFDQRGFGLSARTPDARGYGPEAHAQDLLALMDALHIERAVVVGHSYGAGVALRAALRAPERVAGLVLVSPFAVDAQLNSTLRWAKVPLVGEWLWATSYRGFPGEKYQLAFGDASRFTTLAALDEVEAIQALPGSTEAALATVRGMDYATVEPRYREVSAPIRVVWGEADRVTPIRDAPLLVRQLPDGAALTRLPGVGHMPPWETPAAVVTAVRSALAAVDVAAAPPGSAE